MSLVAAVVVVSFGLVLIAFTVVTFAKPASAERFVRLFGKWHHRFGERVGPTLFRHLRLYAVGSCVFGALLLYGAFAG